LLHSKLKEFLDLEQVNHSVFDYTRQFNTLAQYGSYHIDTDEKKANLYRAGLTIHLQERLVHLSNLSYNELASAVTDQERMMKAVAEAIEKKGRRCQDLREVVILAVLLQSTAWCIPRLGVSYVDHNSSRIGAIALNSIHGNFSDHNHNSRGSSNSSTVLLPHHYSRLWSGCHSRLSTTAFRASTVKSWDISPVSA
jgi:hypothetical protein